MTIMPGPTHSDLHQDLGGLKASHQSMEKRMDRLEQMIADGFKELRDDIADLKIRDRQRGAFEKVAVWFAGTIGAALTLAIGHFWK